MTTSLRNLTLFAGFALAAAASAQRIANNDPGLTYQGNWTPAQDAMATGGTMMISGTVGSSVTFKVTGSNFVLYRKMDANGGYADVTVDGASFGSITFYAAGMVYQIPAVIDELSAGAHTIVLTVSQTQPQGSAGNSVYIDSLQVPAPATYSPTQAQSAAVTETNVFRTLMGLPTARPHLALGWAANAHAKYLSDNNFIANGTSPHVETPGMPDFTAAQPHDRDAYFGYTGYTSAEDSNNSPDPLQFVDEWMDGVYHRWPYLVYSFTDIGFGGYPNGSTMDFAPNVAQPAAPNATTMTTYPANGQTDVWMFYDGSDGPNNVAYGGAYGYPISAQFSYPATAAPGTAPAAPTTGTLTDSSGNIIPVTIADSSVDNQLLGAYVMIPNQPLAPSTTYTATMSGVDPQNNSFHQTWKFTTSNLNRVHDPRANAGTNTFIYTFNWDMPDLTVPSQVEYGPTTAYGTIIPGTNSQGTSFSAQAPGIITTPVTHFRVTAKDAQGNVYASPDHTLLVSTTMNAATIGFVQAYPDPQDTFIQWETAGMVASTQINYGLTTGYGSTIAGTAFGNSPTQFSVDINNLGSGTFHYQITATDANGGVFATGDQTFTIP